MKKIKLLKKLALEENLFHKLGDTIDNTAGNSSFLKGLALGGLGLAAFSDPETAKHVKEAIGGIGDNIHNFWNNLTGDTETPSNSETLFGKIGDSIHNFWNNLTGDTETPKHLNNNIQNNTQLDTSSTLLGILSGVGAGLGIGGGSYALYKKLNKKSPTSGLSSKIKKTGGYKFSATGVPIKS